MQDPAPPPWSVFHQRGGEHQRVVPIKVEGSPGKVEGVATSNLQVSSNSPSEDDSNNMSTHGKWSGQLPLLGYAAFGDIHSNVYSDWDSHR